MESVFLQNLIRLTFFTQKACQGSIIKTNIQSKGLLTRQHFQLMFFLNAFWPFHLPDNAVLVTYLKIGFKVDVFENDTDASI